jgi:hypothetical protein
MKRLNFLGIFLVMTFLIAPLTFRGPAEAALIQAVADVGSFKNVDEVSAGAAHASASELTRYAWSTADASTGSLKAFATGAEAWQSCAAGALVQDTFTYHGPDTALVFAMHVDGTHSAAENAKVKYSAYIGYGVNGSGETGGWQDGPVSGGVDTILYGYRWTANGDVFPLAYALDVAASYIATSDFGATATLSFLTRDSEGNLAPLASGAYLLSEAGYDTRSTSTVPVPPAVLLLGSALASLAFVRAGKKRE